MKTRREKARERGEEIKKTKERREGVRKKIELGGEEGRDEITKKKRRRVRRIEGGVRK